MRLVQPASTLLLYANIQADNSATSYSHASAIDPHEVYGETTVLVQTGTGFACTTAANDEANARMETRSAVEVAYIAE